MVSKYDDLQASYGRCLRAGGFIERFYEIFLASHPAIAPMFAKTDFTQQRLALRRGISLALSYAAGMTMVTRSIDGMADVHSRKGRTPVPPSLYVYWLDSLIAAIREKDPEVNEPMLARWRTAMQVVIDRFTSHY